MKELDLLLVEYLQQHWPDASPRERESFAQILELPDPQLAAYLLGNVECPEETLRPLLATLRGLAVRRVQRERGPPDRPPTRQR
jgi:antitoxin CptB